MNQVAAWSHEIVLAAAPASAARARAFAGMHLVQHRRFCLVDPVRLVASELATSVVTQARSSCIMTLEEVDEAVLLAVKEGASEVPVRALPRLMALGGRGLVITDLLSREWGVTVDGRGSKSVWASFSMQRRT